MRIDSRCALALFLAISLTALPVPAAPNRALGYVLQAQSAQLDGSGALSGTNVYAGDVLETYVGGSLRIQAAGSQFYLLGASAATLSEVESGFTASLTSGTAGFASVTGTAVAIRALDVTARPKTAEPTHAQVTMIGPQELLITSVHGALELELDGKAYSMAPGSTYKVDIQSPDTKQMDAGKHLPRSQRKLILLVFGGTAAAYGGLVIYHELHESPEKP